MMDKKRHLMMLSHELYPIENVMFGVNKNYYFFSRGERAMQSVRTVPPNHSENNGDGVFS